MPGLSGRYQADNAALAVAMLRQQDRLSVTPDALAEGIASADWPARLHKLRSGPLTRRLPDGSELWVDGGHNAAAARLVADHVRRSWQDDLPLVLLFASLASKDPQAMLKPFKGIADAVHTLPIQDHDHHAPARLTALADEFGIQAASANDTIEEALSQVDAPARVLIFGSLYLAGEALRANDEVPD